MRIREFIKLELLFFFFIPVSYLYNLKNQVIAANIDTSGEPRLHGKIPKSKVIEVDGRKIGIIGYLTPETSVINYL